MANEVEIVVTVRGDASAAEIERIRRAIESATRDIERSSRRGRDGIEGMGRGAAEAGVGITGMLAPLTKGIALMGAIPAGALAVGVALTGVGLGFIGLGALAVKNSQSVKLALSSLGTEATRVLTEAGKGMEKPIVNALQIIRSTVRGLQPELTGMFVSIAPHVDNVAVGISGLAKNIMPGLDAAVTASGGVLDQFSAKLPETGTAISVFFKEIAEGAEGGANALTTAMGLVNIGIAQTGLVLGTAAKGYAWFTEGWGKYLGGMGTAYTMFGQVQAGQKGVTDATLAGVDATNWAKVAYDAAVASLNAYVSKLTEATNNHLGARGAERNYAAAIDDATKSLKENGRNLDINTVKGRANHSALDAIARTTISVVSANARAGVSQSVLSGQMQRGADAAFRMAMRFGMSAQAAGAYTQKLFGIPPSRTTVAQLLGVARSQAQISSLKAYLASIPRSVNTTHVTTRVIRGVATPTQGHAADRGMAHGGIMGAATGGIHSGRRWVGEQGPEIIDLPPGTRVHPAGTSRNMAQGGGGNTYVFNFHAPVADQRSAEDMLVMALDNLRRQGRVA